VVPECVDHGLKSAEIFGVPSLANALLNNYRQLGAYAGRILKGESPLNPQPRNF